MQVRNSACFQLAKEKVLFCIKKLLVLFLASLLATLVNYVVSYNFVFVDQKAA